MRTICDDNSGSDFFTSEIFDKKPSFLFMEDEKSIRERRTSVGNSSMSVLVEGKRFSHIGVNWSY